jgi:hypothetical protein
MTTINKPFVVKDDLVIDNTPGRQFVVPWGGDGERPTSPIIGATRLNQDRGVLEIFNGSEWQSAAQAGDHQVILQIKYILRLVELRLY